MTTPSLSQAPREEQLRAALQRIVDWSDCQCEHDTDDCCANVSDQDFHCPGCIAAKALLAAVPSSADRKGGEAIDTVEQQRQLSDAGVKHPADNTSAPSADGIARIVQEMRETALPAHKFVPSWLRVKINKWADALASSGAPQRTAEGWRPIAQLRKEMCDEVVKTKIGKRAHELALRVWKRIEDMRPDLKPEDWDALVSSAPGITPPQEEPWREP